MTKKELAILYHKDLIEKKPFGLWEHLTVDRGLSISTIIKFRLGCDINRNSISIPIYDKNFNVVDIKFRHLTGDQRYSHLKGGKPEIYGWEVLLNKDKFIFVEGELNCLVLRDRGVSAITVSGGAGTFNEEWVPYFKNKSIWFWFDSDEAGKKGVRKIVKLLKDGPKFCKNISIDCLKEKEDAVDYFVKYGKMVEDLKEEIKRAKIISDVQTIEENEEIYTGEPLNNKYLSREEINVLDSFEFIPKVLKIKKFSNPMFTNCPFHKDKDPSFAIYKNGGGWFCYSCSVGGRGNISFVMKFLNLSQDKAISYLKNYYNFCVLDKTLNGDKKNVRNNPTGEPNTEPNTA